MSTLWRDRRARRVHADTSIFLGIFSAYVLA
jgi:hypothetical protein